MAPAEYIQRRSLKRMVRPNDGYLIGIAIEMMALVVGSLSCDLSIILAMALRHRLLHPRAPGRLCRLALKTVILPRRIGIGRSRLAQQMT